MRGWRSGRRVGAFALAGMLLSAGVVLVTAPPAGAVTVTTESAFRSAWSNAATEEITLTTNITLTCGGGTTPTRNSATAITVDGAGHNLHNTCGAGNHGLLRSTGSGQVEVIDITLSGGRGTDGGAVDVNGAPLVIVNATITGNSATLSGGGVSGVDGDIAIYGSVFTNNSTPGPGSAIVGNDGTAMIDTRITNNSVSDEAIADGTGSLSIVDSVISNNSGDAMFAGGGTSVIGSTVANNGDRAVNGIGPATVISSTISGNGGRAVSRQISAEIVQSTITSNGERGVYVYDDQVGEQPGDIKVVQSTITGNATANVAPVDDLTIQGSVIGQAQGAAPNCIVGGSVTNNGDNVADDSTCGITGGDVILTGLGLNALADNGGPTRTRLPAATSPLVDRIPSGDCFVGDSASLTEDQRGWDRPLGDGCDVGAVEACVGGTFSDVPLTSIFARDICWMGVQGITTGFPGNLYKPANSVTRGAMSAFMYRLAGEPPFMAPTEPTFDDVHLDNPFFAEIEWMAEEGITTGFPGNLFKGADPVKRQSMSAFMYRLAGSPAFVDPVTATFNDVAVGSQFFTEVEWMADEGITTGFPDGGFHPNDNVARQAMSAFMRRLAEGPGVGI
jgi:hypothetical protein